MKTICSVIFVFVAISIAKAADSTPDLGLPNEYKALIRDYIQNKRPLKLLPQPDYIFTFFAPKTAKVARGDVAIPKGVPLRAVQVDYTPRDQNGSLYLEIVQSVILFKDGSIVGSARLKDVEWIDGAPKREK